MGFRPAFLRRSVFECAVTGTCTPLIAHKIQRFDVPLGIGYELVPHIGRRAIGIVFIEFHHAEGPRALWTFRQVEVIVIFLAGAL